LKQNAFKNKTALHFYIWRLTTCDPKLESEWFQPHSLHFIYSD
jgi:hypothetical protein